MKKEKNSMLLKFIKHRFQFSKIDNDMFKVNLDSEEDIVQQIHVKWLKCGLRNN